MLTGVQTVVNSMSQIFQNPSKFTRRTSARNILGQAVEPYDPEATCFCVIGLINNLCVYKSYLKLNVLDMLAITPIARSQQGFIHFVNDILGREAVLQMFEESKSITDQFASIPNLDVITTDELYYVRKDLCNSLPICPQRNRIAYYIDHKINGILYRKAGNIRRAVEHETQDDKIYEWLTGLLSW